MRSFLNEVKGERQLKSLIGLSKEAFDELLNEFTFRLEELKNEQYRKNKRSRKRRPGGGRKGTLVTPENKLFLVLYYLKNYPTFDVLGFIFSISASKAEENVQKLIAVLKKAQERLQVLPQRAFKDASEFSQVFEKENNIIIDATEREHFRHQNNKIQRGHYSGKKAAYGQKHSDCKSG